jgi:hypothetical protein
MIQPATLTDQKQRGEKMTTYFNRDTADDADVAVDDDAVGGDDAGGGDVEACSSGS